MKNFILLALAIATSTVVVAQTPNYVPTEGLAGWWPLDGNALDGGTFENHGTVSGAVATTNRYNEASGAMVFDGIDDHIVVPDAASLQITGNLTISLWYKTPGPTGNYQTFLTKRSGGQWPYSFGLSHYYGSGGCPGELDKYITGRRNNGSEYDLRVTEKTYISDEWTHAAMTIENDVVTFYENGMQVGSTCFGDEFFVSPIDQGAPLTFGTCNCGLSEMMTGSLDDIGIWNRALNDEEIASMYESNENPSITGCMDETACNFDPEATEDDGSCINANIVVDDSQLCETGVVSMSVFQNAVEGEPRSLSFSQGNYVRIPNSPSLSTFENGITLECWYKQTSFSGGDEHIVGHEYFSSQGVELKNEHGDWGAYLNGSEGGAGWEYWSDEDYNPPIVQNQWHHIALSSDGQTTKYFLNGEEMDEDVNDLGDLFSPSFSEDFVINRHTWGNGSSSSSRLSGFMDELRLSSVCRYTESFTPPEAEFVVDEFTSGLWHFNEGSGGTVYDASPHGNHGTCLGTGWSEDTPIAQNLNAGVDVFWNGGSESTPTYDASPGETVEVVLVGEFGSCSEIINIEAYELDQGCGDEDACNYSEIAACNLGCVYPVLGASDCDEGSLTCGAGTVWDAESQTCVVETPGDFDFDGCVGLADLLSTLASYNNCGSDYFECGMPLSYQGYDYQTVQIGGQCWFAENLQNENYSNGEVIPNGLDDVSWGTTTDGAMTAYGEGGSACNNYVLTEGNACDETVSIPEYGRLYNWHAVADERGLCPTGWHVPSDLEWMNLEMQLGMASSDANGTGWRGTDQGTQLKNSEGWFQDGNGSNSSGFSGLPAGDRTNSVFVNAGAYGTFWSSTESSGSTAWDRFIGYDDERVYRTSFTKQSGFSVRCIQNSDSCE